MITVEWPVQEFSCIQSHGDVFISRKDLANYLASSILVFEEAADGTNTNITDLVNVLKGLRRILMEEFHGNE